MRSMMCVSRFILPCVQFYDNIGIGGMCGAKRRIKGGVKRPLGVLPHHLRRFAPPLKKVVFDTLLIAGVHTDRSWDEGSPPLPPLSFLLLGIFTIVTWGPIAISSPTAESHNNDGYSTQCKQHGSPLH